MPHREHAAGGKRQYGNLQDCQERVNPVSPFEKHGEHGKIADRGHARQNRDANEVDEVALAEKGDPAPTLLRVRGGAIARASRVQYLGTSRRGVCGAMISKT